MPTPTKILTKEDILKAQKKTRSNLAASRYLNVSFGHYKKYAKNYTDEETGKSLFELHKNQQGKGIPKFAVSGTKQIPLMDLLEGRVPLDHFDARKIKYRLIKECLLEEKCYKCGFAERRVVDTKIPIVLNHKNGDRRNWHLGNLEFLCYNCAFLYGTSPLSDDQVKAMEHYVESEDEYDWEMDEHIKEHLKDLGLHKDDPKPGEEYISKL